MDNGESGRRRFIRRLTTLGAAGGIATLLYGGVTEKPLIQLAQAASGDPILIDEVNTGGSSTTIESNVWSCAFRGKNTNTNGGSGVDGWTTATSTTNPTIGVYGQSDSTSGIGVMGKAGNAGAKPLVARGYSGQTANLQEWQGNDGAALCAISSSGYLGVGTSSPSALLHVSGPYPTPNILVGSDSNSIAAGVMGGTVSGGGGSGLPNTVTDDFGTVGGGNGNTAGNNNESYWATVSGGQGNSASDSASTVGGGANNQASGDSSTVGGGRQNIASGGGSIVGGGDTNRAGGIYAIVGGGFSNAASGACAAIGGGLNHIASGDYSTVPGGESNTASGMHSFAAGRRGNVSHAGAFVWADSSNFDFNSAAANEFAVRATGGARFVTAIDASGNPTATTVIDPSGRFGVGTSSPVSAFQVIRPASWTNADPLIRLDGDTYNVGAFFYAYGAGNFPFFSGRRSRGNQASPSAVQANDLLMRYGGAGYGTNAFPSGNRAMLDFYAAENWTNTTQGTYVAISTTTTGASAPTEKMRITGDGSVLPPSDNTGSIGKVGQRWNLVRAQTITPGDLVFENGVRATEEGRGLAFLNDAGEKIAVLDRQGNFHIKGKFMEDL